MDAIYYDTQGYSVREERGVSVRKATKDDDICLSSYPEPTLFVQNLHSAVFENSIGC